MSKEWEWIIPLCDDHKRVEEVWGAYVKKLKEMGEI